jgi:TfoX/Sxy family transcriptional regulator of competence genes
MASSKEYLTYVLDLLSSVEDITYRSMMSEYILYIQGKVLGGIYDDRFLIKPTKNVLQKIENPRYELPYEGAKKMVLVDSEDREFIRDLIESMEPELKKGNRS